MNEPSAQHRHPTSIGPGQAHDADDTAPGRGEAFWWRWELPALGRSLVVYVLAVEMLALGVTGVLISRHHIGFGQLAMLGVILGLGVGKEELTRHVERMRRRFSDTPHQNMTSVWTFSAALLLPPGFTAVVVAALYAYLWRRIWYPLHGVRPWKVIFSASAVTLCCHTATMVVILLGDHPLANWRAVAIVVVAAMLYAIVNLGVVAGAIAFMTSERTWRRLFGTPADAALEYATLTLGAAVAVLMHYAPVCVLLLIPTLVVLHRAVLTRQLEEATSTDPKTGLLNATTWQCLARVEVERAGRDQTELGLLMIDLDQFSRINGRHGQLVGDMVLAAVAKRLEQQTRRYDVLGRFGGDTFVLLCPGVDVDGLASVAERARAEVERLAIRVGGVELRVTVSIGAAHFPGTGPGLDDLLLAADNALFAAKDQERNQVVLRHGPAVDGQASSGKLSK